MVKTPCFLDVDSSWNSACLVMFVFCYVFRPSFFRVQRICMNLCCSAEVGWTAAVWIRMTFPMYLRELSLVASHRRSKRCSGTSRGSCDNLDDIIYIYLFIIYLFIYLYIIVMCLGRGRECTMIYSADVTLQRGMPQGGGWLGECGVAINGRQS